MVEKNEVKKDKIIKILIDVWVISVIFLMIGLFDRNININRIHIIKSIFPNISSNNWYVSCYIVFYIAHPFINKLLTSLSKYQHFMLCLLLCAVFVGIETIKAYVKGNDYFCLVFDSWLTIYVTISYLKRFHFEWCDDMFLNVIIMLCDTLLIGLLIKASIDATFVPASFDKSNPLVIILGITTLNIIRKLKIRNKAINDTSSLSLLVYVIHENLIFRSYYRVRVCNWFVESFSQINLFVLVFSVSFIVFIISISISYAYKTTFGKMTKRISDFTSKIIDDIEFDIKQIYFLEKR